MVSLLLTGCVPHTELNERAIIEAVGIDFDNGQYTVTMQYYNTLGSESDDISETNVLTAKGTGSSVYNAIADAGFSDGKTLMFGVNQLIIIGENAAQKDIKELLGFATTYYQSHSDVKIAVSEGTAENILSVKFKEGLISTKKLKFLFSNAEETGFSANRNIIEVMSAMSGSTESVCLPLLKTSDTDSDVSEDGRTVEICGGVVYKNKVMADKISLEAMSGVELLSNKGKESVISLKYEGKEISVNAYGIRTEITPYIDDGQLVFSVKTRANGEFLSADLNGNNAALAEEIGRLSSERLESRMKRAAEEAVLNHGTDVLMLEAAVRNKSYGLWLEIKDRWEETLKNSRFEFDTRVEIDRYGIEQ